MESGSASVADVDDQRPERGHQQQSWRVIACRAYGFHNRARIGGGNGSGFREVAAALAAGEGTAWLWARTEMAGAVDVLVIVEAGQMSRANPSSGSPARRRRLPLAHLLGECVAARDSRVARRRGRLGRTPRGVARVVCGRGVESTTGAVAVGGGGSCSRRLSPMPVPHSSPWLRFQSPLVEPDMRISRIRLSDEIMPSPTESSPYAAQGA